MRAASLQRDMAMGCLARCEAGVLFAEWEVFANGILCYVLALQGQGSGHRSTFYDTHCRGVGSGYWVVLLLRNTLPSEATCKILPPMGSQHTRRTYQYLFADPDPPRYISRTSNGALMKLCYWVLYDRRKRHTSAGVMPTRLPSSNATNVQLQPPGTQF